MDQIIKSKSDTSAIENAPVTPEALSKILQIKYPTDSIAVQGIAKNVISWPKEGKPLCVFGRLVLGGFSISFKVPPETALDNNAPVIIKGALTIENASSNDDWRATHKVLLSGHVVGDWKPRLTTEKQVEILHRLEKCSLLKFAKNHNLADLAVLCSGTAQGDITASLQNANIEERPQFVEANFGNRATFLEVLNEQTSSGSAKGIVISRGGGGGLEEIGGEPTIINALITSKLPFYSAIGHDRDIVLLDKYADEMFHTPSGFASSWVNANREISLEKAMKRKRRELEKKLYDQKQITAEREQDILSIKSSLKRKAWLHRSGVSLSWIVVVSALALAAGLIWYFAPIELPIQATRAIQTILRMFNLKL